MKKLYPFLATSFVLVVISFLVSCSSTKTAVNCPELLRTNNYPKIYANRNKLERKSFVYTPNKSTNIRNTRNQNITLRRNNNTLDSDVLIANEIPSMSVSSYFISPVLPSKIDYNKYLTASIDPILTTELREPEVDAIGFSTTNNDLNSITAKNIESIVLANSNPSNIPSSISTNPSSTPAAYSLPQDEQQIEGLGLAGFIAGLTGLLIAAIPFGLIATVFGAISLGKINKYPEKYRGRGFAVTSLVLGIIDLVFGLIIVAAAVAVTV